MGHVSAQLDNFVHGAFDEHLPTTTRTLTHFFEPVRIKFATTVGFHKFFAVNARLVREFNNRRVDLHDATIDAVQLVNQRFDTVVVQVKFVHQQNDFRA